MPETKISSPGTMMENVEDRQGGDANWRRQRARGCFALAHPSEEEMQHIKNKIDHEDELLKKAIVGIEDSSRRGTIDAFQHLQGFLYDKNQVSGWQVQRWWSEKAYWEPAKGSPRNNWKYCTKENNILATKGFEKECTDMDKTREKNEYWYQTIKDSTELSPEQFAQKNPKEWLIRRAGIERIMLEARRKK
jgi:hypothetical protein